MQKNKNFSTIKLLAIIITLILLGFMAAMAISKETPLGEISGTVYRKDTGKPIEGAKVYHPTRYTYVKTDKYGKYSIYGVPVGKHSIRVGAKGFDYSYNSNVVVAEGKATENVDFKMLRRHSNYYLYTYQKVFNPKEDPQISIRGYLVKKVDLSVYYLNPEKHLNIMTDYREIDKFAPEKIEPVFQTIFTSNLDEDGEFSQNFPIPVKKNGLYVVITKAVGGKQSRRTWLLKTDAGLIIKRSPNEILVYAQNFTTGKPIIGANIGVYDGSYRMATGKTDKNGLYTYPTSYRKYLNITAADGDSFALSNVYSAGILSKFKVYTYTERPVYRPGQTVYFKGILRERAGQKYLARGQIRLQVKVSDSKGNNIYNTTHLTTDNGSFYGYFKLSDKPPLGEYSLSVEVLPYRQFSYASFKVSEYKKPEYKIEVSTDKPNYVAGDKIKVKVRGKYYFGAPVKNTPFNITIYESAFRWQRSAWTDFYDTDSEDSESSSYGGIMFEGKGRLDENGEAEIFVPTGKVQYSKYLGIEVEATDISGRAVTGSTNVSLSAGEFALYGYTDRYVYSPDENIKLNIEALDYKEKPVAKQLVNVEIKKISYEETKEEVPAGARGNNNAYYEYRVKRVESPAAPKQRVVTDEKGQAFIDFIPKNNGSYMFYLTANDSRGNTITYSSYTYVYSGASSGEIMAEADLKIITDKKNYNPGDKVKALITTSRPGTYVLITIEGRKIYRREVVYLEKGSASYNFDLKPEYFPNVFISACAIKDMSMISATKDIKVNRDHKKLNISIKPDKTRYYPGDKARYTVKITDYTGKPVEAEFSIGIVDEAIYAIAPDETPDIHEFFWSYDYNYVDTTYSFARDYSGGADKDRPTKIRKNFPDTAFWSPAVRTDKNGRAIVEFTFPDNLTTWVATVRASTDNTNVGSAINLVIATKDLLVRLETPRFLTQKDKIFIGGVVHNYTKKDQNVKVWLESEGAKLVGESTLNDLIKPDEAKDYYWEVEANEPGKAKFTLLCKGKDAEDAMELEVPVYPYGIEKIVAKSGILDKSTEEGQIELDLPSPVIEKVTKLQILTSPSLAGTMLNNVNYLIHYPYGCVEQTMSAMLPAIVVQRALRTVGIQDPELDQKIPKVVEQSLNRLYEQQHGDGGWGWWQDDDTHPYMTAYVVMGFKTAQKNGFKVDQYSFNRGIKALKKMVEKSPEPVKTLGNSVQQGEEWNTRSYVLYALYRIGNPDRAKTLEAYQHKDKMNEYALALLAMNLDGCTYNKEAQEIMNLLDSKAVSSEGECYWEGRTFNYSWTDNRVESTAYCLQAYLQLRPEDPKIAKIINWITKQRNGDAYTSTKDTAAVIYALTDYLIKTNEFRPNYNLKIALNNEPAIIYHVGDFRLPKEISEIVKEGEKIKSGLNRIIFRKEGEGFLYYTARLSYYMVSDKIEAESNGIKVSRRYYLVTRKKDSKGKIVDIFEAVPQDRSLKVGEKLRVEVTVEADKDYQFVLIEDPLPAGFEVTMKESEKNWGSRWWCQQEVHDEKIAFFTRNLTKNKKMKISYEIRSEMSGEVNALPAIAYCMYEPEIRGNSAGNRLKVERK